MNPFRWHGSKFYVEQILCTDLAAEFGTPLFVYSRGAIEAAWREIDQALGSQAHLICYSVKANSNLAVLSALARLGSGFDVVSGGELKRVLAAGGKPDQIVFSGVGKTSAEISQALAVGIHCFNVESASELERLASIASAAGVRARVSMRINPDVDAQTHPYISTGLREHKFGIGMQDALAVYRHAASLDAIDVQGIDCHIGSQLTAVEPYRAAFQRLINLVDTLALEGIVLSHMDVGGGMGIRYRDETPLDIAAWAKVVVESIVDRNLQVVVEPGRYVVGPAGCLLTRVEYLKHNGEKNFAIVDAAMNDFIRPALYQAWHEITPIQKSHKPARLYDVVGPVCESADFLGKDRQLAIEQGDTLAVLSVGAYGFVMSSNYNTRPRAAEVLVDGGQVHLIRQREQTEELFAGEFVLPDDSAV